MSKKYKIEEVISMLRENPDLKFKSKCSHGYAVISNEHGILYYRDKKEDYMIDYYRCAMNSMEREWELIQQPVTWEEALFARCHQKKTIIWKRDNSTSTKRFKWGKWYSDALKDDNGHPIKGHMLTSGAWYIED